jgi:hypothetical protein
MIQRHTLPPLGLALISKLFSLEVQYRKPLIVQWYYRRKLELVPVKNTPYLIESNCEHSSVFSYTMEVQL